MNNTKVSHDRDKTTAKQPIDGDTIVRMIFVCAAFAALLGAAIVKWLS